VNLLTAAELRDDTLGVSSRPTHLIHVVENKLARLFVDLIWVSRT